jgi:hypothetical protein
MFVRLDGIPEPPAGYVPPLGASRSTWTNIYKNKGRIDYCVQQFEVSANLQNYHDVFCIIHQVDLEQRKEASNFMILSFFPMIWNRV